MYILSLGKPWSQHVLSRISKSSWEDDFSLAGDMFFLWRVFLSKQRGFQHLGSLGPATGLQGLARQGPTVASQRQNGKKLCHRQPTMKNGSPSVRRIPAHVQQVGSQPSSICCFVKEESVVVDKRHMVSAQDATAAKQPHHTGGGEAIMDDPSSGV